MNQMTYLGLAIWFSSYLSGLITQDRLMKGFFMLFQGLGIGLIAFKGIEKIIFN